ncbi:MAG: alpha/beta fold hydrolase, partial [Pyrinomonadaceae bacterium]
IISVAAFFILAACSFDSPMMNAPSGQIDERLLGNWVNSGGETTKISKIDNHHYLIEKDKSKFTAYQSDIGNERFITIQAGVKYLFLHYDMEAGGKKLVCKNVSYNLLNETSDTKTIRKVIENSLSNPKLYNSSELILKKIDTGQQSGNTSQNAANNQTPTIKSGRFNSKDAVIYYEIYGAEKSGTPLFVLHGGPGFDHLYFLSNSAFTDLAKNRPVVFYDQRGTGKSAKLTEENAATVKNNVEDLENLRSYLGYSKIDVAGHSWGGFLAMAYAVFFQNNVSHLIIIDSIPSNYADDFSSFEKDYPNENAEMDRKKAESIANNLDPVAMRASTLAYMKMLFYSTQNRDRFIAGSKNYTFDPMVFGTISYSAQGLDITPGLAKLTIPVLILHGRHDSNINIVSAEKIHNAIPKSKLVIFEQSGHMPFYEEKETFDAWMESFLSK